MEEHATLDKKSEVDKDHSGVSSSGREYEFAGQSSDCRLSGCHYDVKLDAELEDHLPVL